jgi:NAD(P)-dependent dehydrogenase (short-subunit alcohol dehydrogenase family)
MAVSVITGGTSGIGRWIALGMAQAGHRLILIVRNPERGLATEAWIKARLPSAEMELFRADLSSLAATRQVGCAIVARTRAIDVLVNNAGVFCSRREVTEEGLERVIAVNHLSPFVLTGALLPALRNAAGGARIVNVGSSTADRAGIDPDDLQCEKRWGMVRAYSQSKLAVTMATLEWAARLAGTGVVANVVHPGAVATALVRASGAIGLAWKAMAPFLLTAEKGADTPLHVAVSPAFATVSGAYVKRRRIVRPNPLVQNRALVARVWQATEALAGEAAPVTRAASSDDPSGETGAD